MSVAIIPSQANHIRAVAAANPSLTSRQIAKRLNVHHHLVELALAKGDRRRIKTVVR